MNSVLDSETRLLVRLAGVIAGGVETAMRMVIDEVAHGHVEPKLVDEVILQSYLFAGFPRTLNAARMWRAVSGAKAPAGDSAASIERAQEWEASGEATCRVVYGESYELLRQNVRDLHPALDMWMITDGYGKVLSRPDLSLKRRELCIVAACAASGQQRQLHSHLHGALNSGASPDEVNAALDAISDLLVEGDLSRFKTLFARVVAKRQNVH